VPSRIRAFMAIASARAAAGNGGNGSVWSGHALHGRLAARTE